MPASAKTAPVPARPYGGLAMEDRVAARRARFVEAGIELFGTQGFRGATVRGFSESLRHELQMTGSTVGVTLVHPGGVRTAISENARLAKGLDTAEVARERANWRNLLALDPAKAAEIIAVAIERRAPRVLVGNDAKGAAIVQWLFPVTYWKHVARDIARRVKRAPA